MRSCSYKYRSNIIWFSNGPSLQIFSLITWLSQIRTIHFSNAFVDVNTIVALSYPFCMYRLEYAYFQINRYIFCSNYFGNLGLHLFCLPYLSIIKEKWFTWFIDCQVKLLKIVCHVMRNWYHLAMMIFSQSLFLVCLLSFKHISNQKPLFGWRSSSSFLFLT